MDEITIEGWSEIDSTVLGAFLSIQEPNASLSIVKELHGWRKWWARIRRKPWRWEISVPHAKIVMDGDTATFTATQPEEES